LSILQEETHFTGGKKFVPWDVTPFSLVDQVTLKMKTAPFSERLVQPTTPHSYIHECRQGMQDWHVTPLDFRQIEIYKITKHTKN
jgi:hypothetical protein